MPKGLVMRSTGSWYEVQTEEKKQLQCRLRGKFKLKELKVTNPIAVGDRVEYILEDEVENTGIITDILERDNYIIRKSVHKTAHGHMLASNLDQAVLIATLALPRTSLGFIDRFLVSAETFRIPSKIVFNKIDLFNEEGLAQLDEICQMYEAIGYECLQTSASEAIGIEAFEQLLKGKKSLISGHSGVGKSTLVNSIAPDLSLRTSEVSSFANKGVHTTTFAEMFEIQPETYIIDTPGIKELGLFDIENQELSHYFPEMRKLLGHCKFHNCLHVNEPKCAVIEALEAGEIAPERYESYLSMMVNDDSHR